MRVALLRSLIALFAAGMLIFAPASERVSEASPGSERAELSTLVLMPTVDSAHYVERGRRSLGRADQQISPDGPLVALGGALALLFVLPIPPPRPPARTPEDRRSGRAPPGVA
ncbi:MAG TPA: hypothetical protein VFD47_10945 [Actinomycetota bacterium]|nr:hypothetical protein [Actinomycetota bacterium]